MSSVTVPFEYEIDDVVCEGAVISADDTSGPRPAVLVFHGWEGRSEAQEAIAGRVADLGYVAVACDLFGNGRRGDIGGDNTALIAPLMEDRSALRRRVTGSLRAVQGLPSVDAERTAAIGFCFGGLCVLDLVRSGAPIRTGASFHGVLTPPPDLPTLTTGSSVAVFHGWDDPMAPPADVVALGAELTEAGADWQIHAYGHTMHAFMAEGVDQPERGLRYDERSAGRAWNSLVRLLDETLGT
jgi:dienelactone hydrolase